MSRDGVRKAKLKASSNLEHWKGLLLILSKYKEDLKKNHQLLNEDSKMLTDSKGKGGAT